MLVADCPQTRAPDRGEAAAHAVPVPLPPLGGAARRLAPAAAAAGAGVAGPARAELPRRRGARAGAAYGLTAPGQRRPLPSRHAGARAAAAPASPACRAVGARRPGPSAAPRTRGRGNGGADRSNARRAAPPRSRGAVRSGPGRAEQPLTGLVGGAVITGKVDRLAVLPDQVLLADYKTGRDAPRGRCRHARALFAPARLVSRGAAGEFYHDRPVRCALVWTEPARWSFRFRLPCWTRTNPDDDRFWWNRSSSDLLLG